MVSRDVVLDEDDAIMIKNDQFPADCCPQVEIPQIEGFVGDRATNAIRTNISGAHFNPNEVLLPKLNILELSNSNSLIPLIWDDQLLHNSFSNLKTLIVKSCGFVKLIPFHVLKSLNNLEELNVKDCGMLEKVFDFEDLNDYKEMESSSAVVLLKKLELMNLPKLKIVWSDHYQGNVSFPSLRSVDVYNCKSLTSIFPAPIAKGMLCDLEELQIRQCGVGVIVAKDQVPESVAVTFGFPSLTSLLLYDLPNLRNFYPQKHTLEWPHLNQLSIQCCGKLEIFEKEVEENMPDSKYPLLSHDKVIGNLESLRLQGKKVEKIGSGEFLTYHFPKLKLLHLSLEEEPPFPSLQFWERSSNLGELMLSGDFEKALGGDNVAALAARFPKLTLEEISIMGSLTPSLVSSPNLTHLIVNWCREWTTLMTSSIARSLVHLTRLSVGYCLEMEEIITKPEGEDDEDKEICFRKLEFLELDYLPRLKRFCRHNYTFRFPLLNELIIKECPKFKILSPELIETPSLKSVQPREDWEKHHEMWDTDLNKILYRQRYVTSRELVLDEDDAIMIRNEQFPADCWTQVEILRIKGFVEEWVTVPYTLLERFPKLNALHVENCFFKEIFPSHALSSNSFHNLTELKVAKCHHLVYLVACSTVKSLVNLEILEIGDCEKMEEIVRNETNEGVQGQITFNRLRILKLTRLPKLKTQEDKEDVDIEDRATNARCTNISRSLFSHNEVLLPKLERLELSHLLNNLISLIWDDKLLLESFSNLKTLIVQGCDFMKSMPLRVLEALKSLKKLEVSFCDKLEKVFGEMESSSGFVSLPLTHLEVNGCDGLTTLMTSSVALSLVSIKHLSISNCNQIKEIITQQEGEDDEDREIIFNQMKLLELNFLPRLKRFCCHNYTFRFPLLNELSIKECPKFKIFSPGLIETPSLKSVQPRDDREKHHEIWDTDLNKIVYRQRYVTSRELVLDKDDAIMIRNDQFLVDCCPQVEILGVEGFVEEWVTFPYTLLERFPKLNELHVKNCSFEEIFPSHAPSSTSFHNLTVLKVSKCHQLVYLVTTSTGRSLMNLETLEIDDCEKLEEIVWIETDEVVEGGITFNGLRILKLTRLPKLKTQEDKKNFNIEDRATNTRYTNTSRSLFSHNKVLLPKLETLKLSNLLNNLLSLIWDDQLLHNSFSNLKSLIVKSCHVMKFVPLCVLKSLTNLEKLEVSNCDKLEKVFGFQDLNDSSSVVVPLSLLHLEVKACRGLTTLMTSSVALSLIHITHLFISNCNQIEEIITQQEGEDDEDREIIFNQMRFLELDNLPRLKRFCGYNYTFRFPLLEHVTIIECPRLIMFCPGAIHAPWLQSVGVDKYDPHKDIWMTDLNSTIQHLFTFEEVISSTWSMVLSEKNIRTVMGVFPNVSRLYVESFTDEGVIFPYSSLERFPQLDSLYVEHCSFEEIFSSQDEIIDFLGKFPPFKELYIAYMDKLKSIWKDDSQLPLIHQNLKVLEVKSCCSLVKLAPSSTSFKDLIQLSVSGCHQLIHLVTTSTAKSLVSLERLEINDCKKMEEIVMNNANDDVESGITFNQLLKIKLTDMPSLKMFSSQSHTFQFPKLEKIKITGCPKMKMFYQGVKLSKVKIEEHDMEWKAGDLNKTWEGLSSAKDSVNI